MTLPHAGSWRAIREELKRFLWPCGCSIGKYDPETLGTFEALYFQILKAPQICKLRDMHVTTLILLGGLGS